MDGKLVVLQKPPGENGPNVEQRLKELTEFISAGGIQNLVVVLAKTDGSVVDCWANGYMPYTMIGGLEVIKQEMMRKCIEPRP